MCTFIIILVVIVVLLVFGTMILGVLGGIINVLYLLFMDFANWMIRVFWSMTISNVPYQELKKMLSELEAKLNHLKNIGATLSARRHPTDELENLFNDFKIDANKAKLNDLSARIVILNRLLRKQQPLEDTRLSEQNAQRLEELKGLFISSEYKLIEQFAKRSLDEEDQDNLSKLQILLQSKGWKLTMDELKSFVDKEREKLHFEDAKSNILASNPENRKDILNSYLGFYESYDTEIVALEQILEERSLSYTDTATLQAELRKLKSELETERRKLESRAEMEQFERSLTDET